MSELNRFPTVNPNGESNPRRLALAVNGAVKGKLNAQIEITLRPGFTTTVISDPRLGVNSVLLLMPTTANADIDCRVGPLYITAQGTSTATINHRNDAAVDRTFKAVVLG